MKLSLYTPIFIVMIMLSTACNGSKQVKKNLSLIELKKTINKLTKDKSCEHTSQCKSTAYGSKPCGGPHKYLIYSTKHTDSVKLLQIIMQHNELEEENNIKNNAVSDCMMAMPSELVCNMKVCEISNEPKVID